MRFAIISLMLLAYAVTGSAQSYPDEIATFRKKYIADLLTDKRAPIKESQVNNISFFAPDKSYCIWADLKESPGRSPFMVRTRSGKSKPYKEYGVLTFAIHDTTMTLHVYQSIDLLNGSQHKDYLFVPFRDRTNYETTYAGGRYIDLSTAEVKDGRVLLDFNKCYNPYCAYADGFSCPIPPDENSLSIEINAGEKMFVH